MQRMVRRCLTGVLEGFNDHFPPTGRLPHSARATRTGFGSMGPWSQSPYGLHLAYQIIHRLKMLLFTLVCALAKHHLTNQAQRPGPRERSIATWTRWPGSLQRMVRPLASGIGILAHNQVSASK